MANKIKREKSKYALKLQYRKQLSKGRFYITINKGQEKRLPLPLPLFENE